MSLTDSLRAAVTAITSPALAGPELLPQRLAIGCAQVLGADAAGVSVFGELRVPLGASDAEATAAERLQITLGDGPCLTALATHEPVQADQDQIADRWPLFYAEFVRATRFRAVASVPLYAAATPIGALDLYYTEPRGIVPAPAAAAAELGRHVALNLLAAPLTPGPTGEMEPAWLATDPAAARAQVWYAIGMLVQISDLNHPDALDLLRGYAYTHDRTLDDLAEDLVRGDLPVHAIGI